MSIVSLDNCLDFTPFQSTLSEVHLSHKTKHAVITLGPHTFSDKWKLPKAGFYTPTDVRIVITPHISEIASVMARIRLVDTSDMSPSRVLYLSQEFNLGHGLTLEGTQLPFCLPVGEYPIQFEVMVSRSQFQATRTMFSTSLEWRMMYSPIPLCRVKSAFATVSHKAMEAEIPKRFKRQQNQSRVAGGGHNKGDKPKRLEQ